MKPSQIFEIMDLARRARKNNFIFNPCFTGAPGLGKTEIIQQWCKAKGVPFIVWTSALLEPPDVRGYPQIYSTANGKQKMQTALPDIWPEGGEGVVILEEVNRGTTSIMNCWMGLTDARRGFDNYTLPQGWIVAACINPEEAEYDVNTMDAALKDRLEFFQVNFDKESFIQFMKENDWDETLVMFIDSGTWSYSLPADVGNAAGSKYISPRTLSKMNTVLKSGVTQDQEQMVYESILGKNVGMKFYHFKYNEQPVLYRDLVSNRGSAMKKLAGFCNPKNYKQGHIAITVKDILEKNEISNELLAEVLLVIPADQGVTLIKDLAYIRKDTTLYSQLIKEFPKLKEFFKSTMNK